MTMVDIAKRAGVSVNTVSHALNDKPDISAQTKREIKQLAKEMGYISNTAASFLRTGKSKTIGIIIGDIANPSFSINIRLLEREFRRLGYSCIVYDSNEDEEIEQRAIVDAIGKSVDGIIICPSQQSEDNIRLMQRHQMPFVLMGRRFPKLDTNYVICDDYAGGRLAAEYLLSKNCRRIANLTFGPYISSSVERLQGVEEVLHARGMELSKDDCYTLLGKYNSSKQVMMHVLQGDYDGVICFNDVFAMEFMTYAKRKIEVVSFDNIRSHFFVPCDFASVGYDKEEFCHTLCETMMRSIHGIKSPIHKIFKTEIYS